jgi:hypothetical protein
MRRDIDEDSCGLQDQLRLPAIYAYDLQLSVHPSRIPDLLTWDWPDHCYRAGLDCARQALNGQCAVPFFVVSEEPDWKLTYQFCLSPPCPIARAGCP